MNELLLVRAIKDDVFTDSMIVAKNTKNKHKSVAALIRKHKTRFERWGRVRFSDLKSPNPKGGRPTKVYLLNEEQAYYLITLLDNNDIVADFKAELVDQFFKMKRGLFQKKEARTAGKLIRREFTNVIQQLEGYAKAQGSVHHGMFYANYTKQINKFVKVRNREEADIMQLLQIAQMESMAANFINQCMNLGIHYSEIYPRWKQHMIPFVAYLDGNNLILTA